MASLRMLKEAAAEAGFVPVQFAGDNPGNHLVFDYPEPLGDTWEPSFWRVHTDTAKVPHVTVITEADASAPKGYTDQNVSLVEAIDFMRRVAREHPRKG